MIGSKQCLDDPAARRPALNHLQSPFNNIKVRQALLLGIDLQNPTIHQDLRANGDGAWFGWPTDPGIEQMRDTWMEAPLDQQKAIAVRIQVCAFKTVPFVPLGYYWQPSAWNKSVTGTFACPITSFWNIGKA